MTTKRFAATCAVVYVMSQILAVAVHGFILSADYAPFYGTLLRPMSGGGNWRMLMLPLAHLSFVVSFVWIYARISLAGPWLLKGLKFGVVGWLVGQVPLWLLWYAEQPWPGALVVKQLGLELVSALILGVVVAVMARGTSVGFRA